MVAKHDQERTAPSTEVIRKFLPTAQPSLILLDELLNYMGRNRKSGLTNQLYSFVQNLSEEARAQERLVVAVSLPSLLDEMTPEDEADFDRFRPDVTATDIDNVRCPKHRVDIPRSCTGRQASRCGNPRSDTQCATTSPGRRDRTDLASPRRRCRRRIRCRCGPECWTRRCRRMGRRFVR